MKKKILALVLAVVLAVGALPISASAAFSKRTTDPGRNNATYNTGNPYSYGQCTWYAWGRYKELCGVSLPSWGNAGTWLDKAKKAGYSTGSTPKEGAIACWNTGNGFDDGHVAVVEEVSGNTARVSQYNRGVSYGGGLKFGGMDGNTWKANYLEKVPGTYFPPTPSGYIYLKDTGKKVDVTFDMQGGVGAAFNQKTYTYGNGEKFGALPVPTKPGYTFSYWADSLNTVSAVVSSDTEIEWFAPSSGNQITLYAKWNSNKYTLSFHANGGSVDTQNKEIHYDYYYGGTSKTLPTPSRSGYTFDGWYTAASGGSKITGDMTVKTTSDQTLYAHWTQAACTTHVKGTPLFCDTDHPHYQHWACAVCGEDFTDGTTTTVETCTTCNPPKLNCDNGHTFGAWETVTEADCETEGLQEQVCAVCGETNTKTIPALEHNYRMDGEDDEVIYYVCTNCGDSYVEEKEQEAQQSGSMAYFTNKNSYFSGLFRDVKDKNWFAKNVSTAYRLGLMKGTSSGVFSPDNNMTIAEVVTLAARIHSIYYTGSSSFSSYDGGSWYDPYVDYARDNGIISENYSFTRPATREQAVHILAKALPETELEATAGRISFVDSGDITYMADVRLLSSAGVINGIKEDGELYFKPFSPITRAEIAALVGRMVQPSTRVK